MTVPSVTKSRRARRESVSTDVGLAAERRTLAQRQRGAAISAAKRLDDSARRDAIADTRTAQE